MVESITIRLNKYPSKRFVIIFKRDKFVFILITA